jgi:hypothetical protein
MLRFPLRFTGSVVSLGLLAAFLACGSSNSGGDGGGSSSGGSSGGNGSGGSSGSILGGSGSGGSSGGAQSGCSDAAKLVYVLSEQNDLYSFDPPNKKFVKIGPLGCQTQMTPNSMAVSRDAVAWVNYVEQSASGKVSNGGIFKVSTADASCQATNIQLPQQWYHLGMGYSTDSATSTNETLFIAATGSNAGLAKLDVSAGTVTPVGTFSGALSGEDAELTGTGDARLYGFFVPGNGGLGNVSVGEITKTNAATPNPFTLTDIQPPITAWAFSFWGGDFYLYTYNATTDITSRVTHYRPSDGSVDTSYMTDVGFTIVGAGVSTCAPTAPPK